MRLLAVVLFLSASFLAAAFATGGFWSRGRLPHRTGTSSLGSAGHALPTDKPRPRPIEPSEQYLQQATDQLGKGADPREVIVLAYKLQISAMKRDTELLKAKCARIRRLEMLAGFAVDVPLEDVVAQCRNNAAIKSLVEAKGEQVDFSHRRAVVDFLRKHKDVRVLLWQALDVCDWIAAPIITQADSTNAQLLDLVDDPAEHLGGEAFEEHLGLMEFLWERYNNNPLDDAK